MLSTLSEADLKLALAYATPSEKIAINKILAELKQRNLREAAQENFMAFVEYIWPDFINGRHHQRMAKLFEDVASGKEKRIIINLGPRHTKSEFASYLLPAWLLGKFPNKKIMQVSNTSELAEGFGRKVRNLVGSERFREVFPDVELRQDSKAAGRWNTNKNGEYFATGVGGALAGRGADICIIDDPHTEAEAIAARTNPAIYDKTYDWYTSGPRQRLQPKGSVVLVMCMTGDTNVLMANGTTTQLKNIRVGDEVATFDKGRLGVSKVNNWRSSGTDTIYTVQTQSGIILRANERHPFLVLNEGVLEWTRLRSLKPGMLLVAMKDVQDLQGHKLNRGCAIHAKLESATIRKTLKPLITRLGTMVSGKVKLAHVESQQKLKDYVTLVTQKNTRQLNQHQSKIERDELNTDMASLRKPTTKWLKRVATDAMFVGNYPLQKIQELIGAENYASTIAITPEKSEGYFATTATSQLDMGRQQIFSNELRRISDFTTDPIVSIVYAGKEEVFDVEVDRTENFIANGIVSHNTRWHARDLTGQIIEASQKSDRMDQWRLVQFPAILPSGKPLWPEFWSLPELEAVKAEIPNSKWQAQYQQEPTSEEGAIVKREWWREWDKGNPPHNIEFTLMSWDTAFEKHNNADYSAMTVWGVFNTEDEDGFERPNIILLDAVKKRVEFPELKQWVLEAYKEWEPDGIIIEKRASGASLIQELRRMGIPVQDFTPTKGNDKISRLNSVADIFASGFVWAPQTRWAEEVIDDVASFPAGAHDDIVDTVSMAMIRFRQGGFVGTQLDEPEEEQYFKRKVAYY
jgi:predicted phage terminase large subunit-like protein